MTSILLVASMYAITKHRLFESRVLLSELLAILLFLGALYLTLRFPSPPYVYYQAVYLTLTIAVGILFLRSVNKEVIATDQLQEANEQLEGRNRSLAALTENLEQANQSLKELMEIKTEFLHIASHQLRTPLTSMRGLMEMQAKGDLERLPYAARRTVTIGKCFRPSWKQTSIVSLAPGLPRIRAHGFAQGEPRCQVHRHVDSIETEE